MKDEIKFIFNNVTEWLKFAEAKHAGLMFLNSGLLFGMFTALKDYEKFFPKYVIFLSFFCFGLSMLFSLISLFPITSNAMADRETIENPNIHFTGHLCRLEVHELKSELSKIYPDCTFDKSDEDLMNQIIVNSYITARKYRIFKLAIFSTSVGIVIPLLVVLIEMVFAS